MQIRKSKAVSAKASDCFALIAFYTRQNKKLIRLVQLGGNVENDDMFHLVKVEFDTPADLYKPSLYLYNHNSTGGPFHRRCLHR